MYGGQPPFPQRRAYTFQQGSTPPTGSIQKWDNTTPSGGVTLFCQIFGNPANPSAIPIREVYFPVIPAPIAFYLGQQYPMGIPVGVEPDYVTEGSGCESVDFDAVYFLTLAYADAEYSDVPIYVFLRSLPSGPFRMGPLGAQVTSVTATLPIESSGGNTPDISLEVPLAIEYGGTGTETPQLIAGTGIEITGTAFDWTISVAASAIQLIEGIPPIVVTGGTGPTVQIGLDTPLALNFGGTGFANPALNAGAGIEISGTIFQPTGGSAWTIVNTGVTSLIPGTSGPTQTGAVLLESKDGSLNITGDNPNNAINFEVANPIGFTIAAVAHLNPATINGGGESVLLGVLPAGTWYVEVIVHGFGLGNPGADPDCTGNTIAMTGLAGLGNDSIIQCQGTRTMYSAAIIAAGNNPGVTISGTGVTLNSGTSYISCGIKAIRIS
jgi:hypothetical protein